MNNFTNEILFNESIKNIKWHTKIHDVELVKDRYFFYQNIKVRMFIFPISKLINFCARTTFEELENIHKFFCTKYGISVELKTKPVVDNSTFSISLKEEKVDLYSFHDFIKNKFCVGKTEHIKKLTFFPEVFPALRVRLDGGTINIFSNGKIIILGAASKAIILRLLYFMNDELEFFKLQQP